MSPAVNLPYFFLAWTLAAPVAGMWLLLGLVGWFKYSSIRPTAVAPVLVLVTSGLVALSVPQAFAFAVSKNALNAAAEECPRLTDYELFGVYRVWNTVPLDENGCRFYIRGGGTVDGVGMAFVPGGPPSENDADYDEDVTYREYDGDWYEFDHRF